MSASRRLSLAVTIPALAFAAIQLVPYGRNHATPPDGQLAVFDSPRTEELTRKACFDCHSNRTKWPWYSSVAPISWRVQSHVDEGRAALNFTALDTSTENGAEAAGHAAEETREGAMPLQDYLVAHPQARLTATERQELARGLERTFAAFAEEGGGSENQQGASGKREASAGESAEHERAEQEGAEHEQTEHERTEHGRTEQGRTEQGRAGHDRTGRR